MKRTSRRDCRIPLSYDFHVEYILRTLSPLKGVLSLVTYLNKTYLKHKKIFLIKIQFTRFKKYTKLNLFLNSLTELEKLL